MWGTGDITDCQVHWVQDSWSRIVGRFPASRSSPFIRVEYFMRRKNLTLPNDPPRVKRQPGANRCMQQR